MFIQKKRYYERILVTTKRKNKEEIEKKLLNDGYTIFLKTLGGRERFKKDPDKIRISAEREVLISEIKN
jgi:hypothetical protein